ncbi:MAG: hypothetical protein O3C43_00670 [Verrucomicrobia bacterium]|nr:hypothetical protein [Verrucomicrobiota bacterium]MDA1064990.1 hypothetical protein [Verrucomicrobiota bacterium]
MNKVATRAYFIGKGKTLNRHREDAVALPLLAELVGQSRPRDAAKK